MNYQHSPYRKPDPHKALQIPVYNSAAYEFDNAQAMEAAFTGKTPDHCYSRISNPTVQFFEDRVKQITSAFSVTALNSGMAAISNVFFTLAKSGTNIVTSPHLFGNTWSFFSSTLADFGVETRFCDLTNLEETANNIDENTCAIFLEIITNPQMEVADLKGLSEISKRYNVPLIADTTIIPFCQWNAGKAGIDIEIVSSTKYISGGATSLGGLIIDYGKFNWSKSPKLKELSTQFGFAAFTAKLLKEIHRNLGAYMTPHAAYMQTLGIETLEVRYTKMAGTCKYLAGKLCELNEIKAVNYTALPGNRFYDISQNQFDDLPGAMLTFDLESREKCFDFLNKLKLIKRATNLFDNKSLAIHPASTIYGNFSEETRKSINVKQETIRLSVGLEDRDDLLNDIVNSLK
jgi:O-acetylhomoserine (thiol)-lyase